MRRRVGIDLNNHHHRHLTRILQRNRDFSKHSVMKETMYIVINLTSRTITISRLFSFVIIISSWVAEFEKICSDPISIHLIFRSFAHNKGSMFRISTMVTPLIWSTVWAAIFESDSVGFSKFIAMNCSRFHVHLFAALIQFVSYLRISIHLTNMKSGKYVEEVENPTKWTVWSLHVDHGLSTLALYLADFF